MSRSLSARRALVQSSGVPQRNNVRLKAAPRIVAQTPSHREDVLARFPDVDTAVRTLRPATPLHCLHGDAIVQAATAFRRGFDGDAYYALKANPDPWVVNKLFDAGIRCFDVASISEVRTMRQMLPDAELAFMHPAKGREAIRLAYHNYGVRAFVLDTYEELLKIEEETQNANDLLLIVRIAMPKGSAACALAGKFGADPTTASEILRRSASGCNRVGVSFHVGSQTVDPLSYEQALATTAVVIEKSGVKVSVIDVGGGFPVHGLGIEIPPLDAFFATLRKSISALGVPADCALWCEPGRALVARSTTLVVRVELRKDDALYINDGSYGNMFEVATSRWRNNVRLIRHNDSITLQDSPSVSLAPFRFFGPTCDSIDYMPGPFMLPDDVQSGDWIAIEAMGAYGIASRSGFNGFGDDEMRVEIA